jgi:hypothetical protein
MNKRLGIFILTFLLILGAVVVYAKNNFKSTGNNAQNNLYKLDTIKGPRVQNVSPTMN